MQDPENTNLETDNENIIESATAQLPGIETRINQACQQQKEQYDKAAMREFELLKMIEKSHTQIKGYQLELEQVVKLREGAANKLSALEPFLNTHTSQ